MTTIVFTTSSDLLSRAIRAITRSDVSHCGLGLDVEGVPLLLHASLGGVIITPRAKWLHANRLVAEFGAPTECDVAGALATIGERYDYVGLLGFAPTLLARWFGARVRNPFASPKAMVCSELVARAMRDVWPTVDPEDVTPNELFVRCGDTLGWQDVP